MKPTPKGWPRFSQAVYYRDAGAAIDWLVSAFGFEVRMRIEGEDGTIAHSELTFGEGLVMIGGSGRHDEGKEAWQDRQKSPLELGGANTQSICVFVDDVDAHCAHARAAGGVIVREPKTEDHGPEYWADRSYGVLDPEGHLWWFMERVRTAGED